MSKLKIFGVISEETNEFINTMIKFHDEENEYTNFLPDDICDSLENEIIDLLFIEVKKIDSGLSQLVNKIDQSSENKIPVILISEYPYSIETELISSLHNVKNILRMPLDTNDVYLCLNNFLFKNENNNINENSFSNTTEFLKKYCHDVNNFIERIMTSSSFLEDPDFGETVNSIAKVATDSSKFLSRYVQRVANLQGSLSDKTKEHDLNNLINKMMDKMILEFNGVNIKFNGDAEELKWFGNRQDLMTLLEEILKNSVEEIEKDDEKTIEIQSGIKDEKKYIIIINKGKKFEVNEILNKFPKWKSSKNNNYHKGIGIKLSSIIAKRLNIDLKWNFSEDKVYTQLIFNE